MIQWVCPFCGTANLDFPDQGTHCDSCGQVVWVGSQPGQYWDEGQRIDLGRPIKHWVSRDFAGVGGGHERLTCHTCDEVTLVRAPYMNAGQWREAVIAFLSAHPGDTVLSDIILEAT